MYFSAWLLATSIYYTCDCHCCFTNQFPVLKCIHSFINLLACNCMVRQLSINVFPLGRAQLCTLHRGACIVWTILPHVRMRYEFTLAPTMPCIHLVNIRLQLCVRPSVRALRRVNGSQSTPSQKLMHPSTERHGGYGRGAVEGAHDGTTYG